MNRVYRGGVDDEVEIKEREYQLEVRIYYVDGYMVPSKYYKQPDVHHPVCVIVSPLDVRTLSGMKEWLTTPKGLPSERRPALTVRDNDSIMESLTDQITRGAKFPNTLMFLDIVNMPMTMEAAIQKCPRCNTWCGRTCF